MGHNGRLRQSIAKEWEEENIEKKMEGENLFMEKDFNVRAKKKELGKKVKTGTSKRLIQDKIHNKKRRILLEMTQESTNGN